MARYGRLFPARTDGDASRLVVKAPRAVYMLRGILSIFVAPLIGGLIALLLAINGVDDAALIVPVACGLGGVFVIWGIALLVLSGTLSAKTEVAFDRVTVRRARDGAIVPTPAAVLVRVRKGDAFGAFHVLELVAQNGETFAIHERLPMQPESLALIANEVATWLGVPAEVPKTTSAIAENHAAVLCYLPIQGIFLVASLWFIASDRRPFVRFAARQSLLHFAFSIVILIVALALGATPVLLTENEEGPLRVVAIVWLVVLLVAYVTWNIGAHIYACVQASKGRAWVMPWLRFVVRPLSDA